MMRKFALLSPFLALASAACAADRPALEQGVEGPSIAITVDDLPAHGPLPPGERLLSVASTMVGAFMSNNVPATGFVNGSFGAGDKDAPGVLILWKAAQLPLGNHTFSHRHLSEIGAEAFLADLDKGASFVAGQPKILRYPFLDEGNDPAVRDAVRAGLAKRHYQIAAVTLSFDDYAYNAPYVRCLAQHDEAAIKALEERFLESARVDAERARKISQVTQGRDVPYVLLMHIGVFSAKMMPRLIAQYRAMGFSFTSLDEAQRDPFYAAAVDPTKPGPTPTIENLARQIRMELPTKLPIPGDEICPAK